ncbi:hypothetical protein [Rathayibacter sp. PhB127]|uniref:hypothetical protein n=1 Tax=Rathayibacter sp. PhB127 TaxID=2485176 RepID=UPI0011CE9196|nr:hypothetical protein [Rathayibacter sp. PhB127]
MYGVSIVLGSAVVNTSVRSPEADLADMVATAGLAPWWGVPVVAGSFLILGAILGFVFNRVNESAKARREDSIRWTNNILLTATDFRRSIVAATDGLLSVDSMREDWLSMGADEYTANQPKKQIEIAQSLRAAHAAADDLALIAPTSVHSEALRFLQYVDSVRQDHSELPSDFIERRAILLSAFRSEIRSALKVR